MATIVLSAIGTAIGGPIGGALGALIGNQVDRSVFGGGNREGPRLKELGISTSSYGTPLARHFGSVRAPGSVIWATELVESSENSGGGKGQPSVTTYSYSTSFAVALASRPIRQLGRIWADGNLLRGAAGDLKVGGELRIYLGHGDQPADPLIAADKGTECPAFRGLAYCVFEGLQLADFGNRIPALTFEIIADDGAVQLEELLPAVPAGLELDRSLDGLTGFSDEGGALSSILYGIRQVYPFSCDASGSALTIAASDVIPPSVPTLAEAAADPNGDGFGTISGNSIKRSPDRREIPDGLRYYDISRDYQAGLQRADGQARTGQGRIIEFPGAMDAANARGLVNKAAQRSAWASETISWRLAELDPQLAPGQVVRVPWRGGLWRIEQWEWRDNGVEIELGRIPHSPARVTPADPGAALPTADLQATPTELLAFELPWDGQGNNAQRIVQAAVSSSSAGWTGAALYADNGGALSSLGPSGRKRSIIGQSTTDLPAGSPHLVQRAQTLTVELASEDFILVGTSLSNLANGANRAWLGGEIIQFGTAERIGGAVWRIGQILRGRGGTEAVAQDIHPAGTPFALLDSAPVTLDIEALGAAASIAAIGMADTDPVTAAIMDVGTTLRPLCPVHPKVTIESDGSLNCAWTRRSRGAWGWPDLVEIPLNEESEAYLLGIGDAETPDLSWEVQEACLSLSAIQLSTIQTEHPGKPLWVRQVGSWSKSDPLLLLTLT